MLCCIYQFGKLEEKAKALASAPDDQSLAIIGEIKGKIMALDEKLQKRVNIMKNFLDTSGMGL